MEIDADNVLKPSLNSSKSQVRSMLHAVTVYTDDAVLSIDLYDDRPKFQQWQ